MEEESPLYTISDPIPLSVLLFSVIQHFFSLSVLMLYPVIIATAAGQEMQIAEHLISMTLLVCGIGTLLQASTKTGSGCTMPIIPTSSYFPASFLAIQMGGLSLLHSMLIFTGLIEILFSRFSRWFRMIFPPEVIGVVLFLVGMSIVGFVIPLFFGVYNTHSSLHVPSLCVGIITLGSMICFHLLPSQIFRHYVVLLGIIVGYVSSLVLGILSLSSFEALLHLPLIRVPHFVPIEYAIDLSLIIPFTIAMICVMLKSVSNIAVINTHCSRSDPNQVHVRRGVCAEGVANSLSGILGGVGVGMSSTNTGLILATGIASRWIGIALGFVLLAAAFFPMLTGILYIMPEPVMGAVLLYVIVFLMIQGLQLIVSRHLSLKRTFVVVLPMIFGFSTSASPWVYADLPFSISPIFASPLTIGALSVIFLGFIMRIGTRSERNIVIDVTKEAMHKSVFHFFEECGDVWTMDRMQVSVLASAVDQILHQIAGGLSSHDIVIRVHQQEQKELIEVSISYVGECLRNEDLIRYARGALVVHQDEGFMSFVYSLQ